MCHQCVRPSSSCLSVKPDFLLLLTHTLLICWDVEQEAIPTAFFHILHLFGTPCLVHVSLHPTILTVLRGISIPTFSTLELFSKSIIFLLVAPYQEWLLALFGANLHIQKNPHQTIKQTNKQTPQHLKKQTNIQTPQFKKKTSKQTNKHPRFKKHPTEFKYCYSFVPCFCFCIITDDRI